jgi:chemotaxis protein MotD
MTALGAPAQTLPHQANGAVHGLSGDRSAGGARDAQDSSTFDALLGSLDDSSALPLPPAGGSKTASDTTSAPLAGQASDEAATTASWRSASAVHALGSGVLVGLDKRLNASPNDHQLVSTKASKAKAEPGADATLASIGWAALIGGVTAASVSADPAPHPDGQAPGPALAAPTSAPLPASLVAAGGSANSGAGGTAAAQIQDVMPLEPEQTAIAQTSAPSAVAQPVVVTVVRAITYLGLDPTIRNVSAPASKSAVAAAGSLDSLASQGAGTVNAPATSLGVQNDAAGTANENRSGRDTHGAGSGNLASKTLPPEGQTPSPVPVSGPIPTSASITLGNSLPLVPVDRLADVVASAAGDIVSQSGAPLSAAASPNADRTAPVKELDVQMNPASLGALSIQMRLSNGKLNVTIKVDKSDTLKLVETQRGAISDKLKALNFSVESVSVKASEASAPNSASADASHTGTSRYDEGQHGQSGHTTGESHHGRSPQGGDDRRQLARRGRENTGESGDGNFGHRVV